MNTYKNKFLLWLRDRKDVLLKLLILLVAVFFFWFIRQMQLKVIYKEIATKARESSRSDEYNKNRVKILAPVRTANTINSKEIVKEENNTFIPWGMDRHSFDRYIHRDMDMYLKENTS